MTDTPSTTRPVDERLKASWDANASAWTTAVRGQHIPSRRAGTDAAVVAACTARSPARVLDVGCGEGWLSRAIAAASREVVGIDGSAGLIDEANRIDVPGVCFELASYEQLIADAGVAAGPWDLIICNFALLGDPLSPLLAALARRLAADGCLLIQTVHPWPAMGDGPYECGWREEQFTGFGVAFPAAMPWYFRTLGSWQHEIDRAGLTIRQLDEPLHPETRRPLSLLLHCETRG